MTHDHHQHRLPDILQRFRSAVEADGYPVSGTFQFRCSDTRLLAEHFFSANQRDASHNDLLAKDFLLFGATGAGSLIGVWSSETGQPIVLFGSEGDCTVLAASPEDFVRLLGIGYPELDAYNPWTAPSTDDLVVAAWLRNFLATERLDIPTTAADIHSAVFALNRVFLARYFDTAFLHLDYGQFFVHGSRSFAPPEVSSEADIANGYIACQGGIAFYAEDRDNYCCSVSLNVLTAEEFEKWRNIADIKTEFCLVLNSGPWVSGVGIAPWQFKNGLCEPGTYQVLVHSNRRRAKLRPEINLRYSIMLRKL